MSFEALIQYIKKGNKIKFSKALKQYLKVAGNSLDDQDVFGNPLLIWATTEKQWTIMRVLVKKGADVNQTDAFDKTPLMHVISGNLAQVKYLIENGADPNKMDMAGETVLMMAAKEGQLEMVEFLLDKGANLNHKDRSGQNALVHSLANNHTNISSLLLEKGISLIGIMALETEFYHLRKAFFDLLEQSQRLLPSSYCLHNTVMKERIRDKTQVLCLHTNFNLDLAQLVNSYLYYEFDLIKDIEISAANCPPALLSSPEACVLRPERAIETHVRRPALTHTQHITKRARNR